MLLFPAIGWLRVRALAHPNARSGHVAPTPQGAGLVVIPVALLGATGAALASDAVAAGLGGPAHALATTGAVLLLMSVGFLDDARPLPVVPRFAAQSAAVLLVLLTLPSAARVLPFLPLPLEKVVLFLGLAWFVNLTNFMDGMDGITATETTAVTLGIVLLATLGLAPAALGWPAAALLGATLGFAFHNAPPARVFLGDTGSLPLGLLLGTLLLHLASAGAWGAALILPFYYLADATVTLLLRLLRRERFWEAHRQHFYQRALRQGWSVKRVLAHVGALNVALGALAIGAATTDGLGGAAFYVCGAAALTAAALRPMAGPPG